MSRTAAGERWENGRRNTSEGTRIQKGFSYRKDDKQKESQTVGSKAEYINLLQQICFRSHHETKKEYHCPKTPSEKHQPPFGAGHMFPQGANSRCPLDKKAEKCWCSPVHLGKQAVL